MSEIQKGGKPPANVNRCKYLHSLIDNATTTRLRAPPTAASKTAAAAPLNNLLKNNPWLEYSDERLLRLWCAISPEGWPFRRCSLAARGLRIRMGFCASALNAQCRQAQVVGGLRSCQSHTSFNLVCTFNSHGCQVSHFLVTANVFQYIEKYTTYTVQILSYYCFQNWHI